MAKHKDTHEEQDAESEEAPKLFFPPVTTPDPITVSQLEKMTLAEKQEFRAKGGTVTNDPE